jgi:ABC-type dipeptide/oligopeptide/nickel transport system ATPase component
MEPEFLILDEPVSSLDVSIQAQIINLLADIKEKFSLTYLFISHDLNLVSYLSGSIGVMYAGRLVEIGNTDSILERPAHPYTSHLFSSVPSIGHTLDAGSLAEDGVAREGDAGENGNGGRAAPRVAGPASAGGCAYRALCPLAIESCHRIVPELRPVGKDHFAACHVAEVHEDD